MRVRNSCILLCAALLAAACSTTRRLGTDEVLYTGVRKIRIEPDSGVVLSAAAESAVKEPLSVAPNNPLYSPYLRTPLPIGLWAYNYLYTPEGEGDFKYWLYKRLAKQPVLISKVQPGLRTKVAEQVLENYGYFGSQAEELPALPQARQKGQGLLYAPHRAAVVLLEHLLPAGRGRPAAPDRQHAGDLPAAGRGAVQHGLADARTQAHIAAAAQQGLLLFPARIHGIPRRHDRRTATGRPAAEPQTERPGGGPQTLPRGRHHGPPHQHQTRSGRYVPPAGRAGHRPKADENTPEDTLPDALARTRPALHRGRTEPHADRPQQTGHFPLGQSGRQRRSTRCGAPTRWTWSSTPSSTIRWKRRWRPT